MDMHDGRIARGTPNYARRCTPQHQHAELLKSNLRLERFELIFTVVRHPVARLRSEYLWRNRKKENIRLDTSAVESWAANAFARFQQDPYIWDNHLRPQAEFLLHNTHVIHFEQGLAKAINQLSSDFELGIKSTGTARSGEQETGLSSSDVPVSERLRSRITTFYRSDFQAFNYDVSSSR